MRSITSYAKVRTAVSEIIRGNSLFVRKKKSLYLNVGCGPYPKENFINLDYNWEPAIDICWDITKKKYPLPDQSLKGIYTEHCMEHITLDAFKENCKEFFRMLQPGGIIRIVVPDGELYFDLYHERKNGKTVHFPYEEGHITGMSRINELFRRHGHLFIYDFETMKKILEAAGFVNIRKESYRKGNDPVLLLDLDWRAHESLYVEAGRP